MINKATVTPVGLTTSPVKPTPTNRTISDTRNVLKALGVNAEVKERLQGGVVSQVYSGSYDNLEVVIKHTFDYQDDDPTNYFMPKETQLIDNKLLLYLANDNQVRVPKIYKMLDQGPITIMEDLRSAGFHLFSDSLLNGQIQLKSAPQIGRDIANIQQAFAKHPTFKTVLSGPQLYYSRGQELSQSYHSGESFYQDLNARFTTHNQQLTAVDTHPKNTFTDKDGNVAWIDFGCSVWGDRDFALPNFLAHVAIYAITDYIAMDEAIIFIKEAVESYRTILEIDDETIIKYLAAEIIHRWSGKWIQGIETKAQKLKLLSVGMTLIEDNVTTLQDMSSVLNGAGVLHD